MIPRKLEMLFRKIRTPVIFATAGDEPHATPMNWDYDGDFWITPAGGSKKVQNMHRNKRVCIACIENMRREGRGFIFWGEIINMKTGFLALLKNSFRMRRMLSEKATIGVGRKLLKYAYIYSKHPSINYSALPWKRYFARIKILHGNYWLQDGIKHQFNTQN